MAAPTLAFRIGILALVILGGVILVAIALAIMFFTGLAAVSGASLAIGLLIFVTLAAAIALTLVLGAGLIAAGLLALSVFIVASLVVSPAIGIVAVLLFLLLLTLVMLTVGNPIGIPFWLLLLALLLLPGGALLAGLFGAGGVLVVTAILGYVGLALFGLWLTLNVHRMPIELLGLGGLRSMPAIPLPTVLDFADAAVKLKQKEAQRQIPINAMTNVFTLGTGTPRARTDDARTFLFGGRGRDDDAATQYSLDAPSQFDMGWTTYEQVDTRAAPLSAGFQTALTSATAGTTMFWTNIARYWNPFGVMPIRLVTASDVDYLRKRFGAEWVDPPMQRMIRDGSLFMLDMTIFESMDPPTASSSPRFSPSTLTLFELDATRAAFIPFLIRVSDGINVQVYCGPIIPVVAGFAVPAFTPTVVTTPNAWLYALQALKASTTVWGIWLGHVYRFHIVTTAMQMTMLQRLPPLHPVRQILGRQSHYTIGFDAVLLVDWSFPPPTSCGTSIEFLQLIDAFAGGRLFFDDDPEPALARQGLAMLTFSTEFFRPQDINLQRFVPILVAEMPPAAAGADPIAAAIVAALAPATVTMLTGYAGGDDAALAAALATDLNAFIAALGILAGPAAVAGVVLSPGTAAEAAAPTAGRPGILNRMILQDAYPASIAIMEWNLYPVAHYMASIYRIAARYVAALMAAIYPLGAASPVDPKTQEWLEACRIDGNVQGLPTPGTNIGQLTSVLTSLIYRITAHGLSRLAPVGNPGLSWVGNFPPCLEDSRLPNPANPAGTTPPSDLTLSQLLAFMPKTGTIGEMISFIFSFGFTDTFQPLIPIRSANTTGLPDPEVDPFVGLPAGCYTALDACRTEMIGFMRHFIGDANALNLPAVMNFTASAAQIHQWELNIEQ